MMKTLVMLSLKILLAILPLAVKAGTEGTSNGGPAPRYATVKVRFIHKPVFDSLFMICFNDGIYDGYDDAEKPKVVPVVKGGVYYFTIPVTDSFVYCKLYAKRPMDSQYNNISPYYTITNYNYLQNGDVVDWVVDCQEDQTKSKSLTGRLFPKDFKVRFEGKGALPCTLKYVIDSMLTGIPQPASKNISSELFTEEERRVSRYIDSVYSKLPASDQCMLNLLKTNTILSYKMRSIYTRYSFLYEQWQKKDPAFTGALENYRSFLLSGLKNISKDAGLNNIQYHKYLLQSPAYPPYYYALLTSLKQVEGLEKGVSTDGTIRGTTDFLNMLLRVTAPDTRDRMIVYYFKDQRQQDHWTEHVNTCMQIAVDERCKTWLRSLLTVMGKEPAYDFALKDTTGKIVKLSDLKGKVVFIDFWFTECPGCPAYFARVVKDVEMEFRNHPDVVFVAVSTDISKQKWLRSIYSGKYTSAHELNLYTGGNGHNDVVTKKYNIEGYPAPMLIDKNGYIIEYRSPVLQDKQKLSTRIKSLL